MLEKKCVTKCQTRQHLKGSLKITYTCSNLQFKTAVCFPWGLKFERTFYQDISLPDTKASIKYPLIADTTIGIKNRIGE